MATLTINTTAAQDSRIAPAMGELLGLTDPGTNNPRSATAAEIKAHVVAYLTNIVRNYEKKVAVAAVAEPTPIAPT